MSFVISSARLCALAAAVLLLGARPASAVDLLTDVIPVYQISQGATVQVGLVVHASTNFNRLTAGGRYDASCAWPEMQPTSGERTLSTSNIVGGLFLHTTVPEWLPGRVNMPGFYSLSRGQTVRCTFDWSSRAVEGGYTIGAGGISYQVGNGERTEGGTRQFTMTVPGDPLDFGNTCIP